VVRDHAEQFDRLKATLADRHRIERELGQGGTATVCLAEVLKHERQGAVHDV
jgi:serine/threonine-protein kinase